MKKLLLALLVPLLVACFPIKRPTHQVQPKSVVDVALNHTVALLTQEGFVYCSGVIVDHLILTAAHCVGDGQEGTDYSVAFRGLADLPIDRTEAELLEVDILHDLAILRTKEYLDEAGRLLAPEPPLKGEKAVVVGHPLGLTWTITEGIVAAPRRCVWAGSPTCMMQLSLPVTPGNSGGPVYNIFGEVIGIVSFRMRGEPHISGATAWIDIRNLLAEVTEPPTPSGDSNE